MAGTTTRGFAYPQNADAPNIAADIQALAEDIDTYFDAPAVATSITFEGSTADAYETTLTVTNPTADRTITLPNISGTVVTTGDTGTVTSTMLADSYQTTASATTAETNAQNFSRVSVFMLGGM